MRCWVWGRRGGGVCKVSPHIRRAPGQGKLVHGELVKDQRRDPTVRGVAGVRRASGQVSAAVSWEAGGAGAGAGASPREPSHCGPAVAPPRPPGLALGSPGLAPAQGWAALPHTQDELFMSYTF